MSSVKVIVENKKSYNVELSKNGMTGVVDEKDFSWDVIELKKGSFSVIKDNKSYNVEVIKSEELTKEFVVKVNGLKYQFKVQDKYDELLQSLGMDTLSATKFVDLKAPMPGLVLDVAVQEGETVKKGDTLLILEAMKMENVIKSPTDGTVKNISVNKGEAVEKNQLILNFE